VRVARDVALALEALDQGGRAAGGQPQHRAELARRHAPGAREVLDGQDLALPQAEHAAERGAMARRRERLAVERGADPLG
jgi:hypothetical protein